MFDFNMNFSLWGLLPVGVLVMALLWVGLRHYQGGASLRVQLLFTSVASVLISVFLVVLVVIWQSRAIFSDQIARRYLDIALSGSRNLAELLAEQANQLNVFVDESTFYFRGDATVSDAELVGLSEAELARTIQEREKEWAGDTMPSWKSNVVSGVSKVALNSFLQKSPMYTQLIFVNKYGCLSSLAGAPSETYCFNNEPWWIKAWDNGKGNIYVGNIIFSAGNPDTTIDVAVPIRLGGGETAQGILRGRISLDKLGLLRDQSSLGQSASVMLVNPNKEVIYSSDSDEIGKLLDNEVSAVVASQPDGWGTGTGLIPGETILFSYAVMPPAFPEEKATAVEDFDLAFMVREPINDALFAVNRLTLIALGGGLLVLLLTIALATGGSRRIARPIEALTAVATEVAAGNLNKTAVVSGPLELRTLATAFNDLTTQLGQMLSGLEEQVQRRTQRLEVAASLGERLSANLDFDTLLEEVVGQIQANFKYYYAHIYLLDDKKEKLVVAAGTGEVGRLMKAGGHSLSLDLTNGLVIRAYHSGKIVRVDDVRQSSDWLPNILLPDTRSEMAVPIMVDGQVLGVLDVQENRVAGFDEGDASLLKTLANQVAVALRNSRLYARVEQALADARALQARYLDQSWDQSRRVVSHGQYHYAAPNAPGLDALFFAPDGQLLSDLESSAIVKAQVDEQDVETIAAPIKFRERAIGSLQVYPAKPDKSWGEDDMLILNAVVDQLGQAAENLRMFEEAREKAGREQTIREITERMRDAVSIQDLVKVVVEQLGNRFSVEYAVLDLGGETPPPPANGHSNGKHPVS